MRGAIGGLSIFLFCKEFLSISNPQPTQAKFLSTIIITPKTKLLKTSRRGITSSQSNTFNISSTNMMTRRLVTW